MQSDPTTPLLISLTKTTYYVTVPNYMIRGGGADGAVPPPLADGGKRYQMPPPPFRRLSGMMPASTEKT